MFEHKKHNPYVLNHHSEPQELQNLIDQTFCLYEQCQFLIGRIRSRWYENGYHPEN